LAVLNAKERAIFRPVPRLLPALPEWVARPPGNPWSPGQATGILEFFVTDNVMCSFFITGAGTAIYRHRLPPGALAHGVTRLRALLENPDAGARELARRSSQLYRWLVAPHEEQMRGLKRLVVIPYGILNYVPFCMLGDERMLLDQFEVCRAPSAAILDQLLAAPAPAVGPAIVFADPHPDDDRLGLPYAAEEARRIVTAMPAETVSGPAATTDRFLAALDSYDVLHLACHALFDPHEPHRSSLIFADTADPRRPAYLSVSRLYSRRTRARLAVLSGCQTGLADLAPGGELDGLVRAFLMAGVRTVIASQWRVDDEATADLMAAMYGNLSAGQPAGAALRAAQLAVRGNPGFAHPYFWAAFELSGDWRLRATTRPLG
jgi:CHAT domain-containing protein